MTSLNPSSSADADAPELRKVHYEYSDNWVPILAQLRASLFVSTYQAGKLVVVGVEDSSLNLSFHNFERAMGVAVGQNQLAVGGKDWIYFLKNAPELAPQVGKSGTHDACFLMRGGHYSGEIAIHEIAWGREQLVITNTRFSCLCTLDNSYSFVPQWQPPFISALAAEDRCHLNGMAMQGGAPRFVTVLDQTDTGGGWRPHKATNGCVLETPSGHVVAKGLAMPHSPRVADANRLWVLNSGLGCLSMVTLSSGTVESVVEVPGYPRGLAIANRFAFVGLSKARETDTFGELPICDRTTEPKCGVAIIDLPTGKQIGLLEFQSGVDEIFDVQLLPGVCNPYISGPFAAIDGHPPIWMVPQPTG